MSSSETEVADASETPNETAHAPEVDREQDLANLRGIAKIHGLMILGAITLWGAADTWATVSGWGIAVVVAVVSAVVAAYVIASTLHEWGHYAGARLSGAAAPVFEKPIRYFFLFNFQFEQNDARQFLWMSWGGILVPWLLVLAVATTIPIDTASRAMLFAAFVARAVQVSAFEVPIAMRTGSGGTPKEELGRALEGGLERSRYIGVAVGALVWLAA